MSTIADILVGVEDIAVAEGAGVKVIVGVSLGSGVSVAVGGGSVSVGVVVAVAVGGSGVWDGSVVSVTVGSGVGSAVGALQPATLMDSSTSKNIVRFKGKRKRTVIGITPLLSTLAGGGCRHPTAGQPTALTIHANKRAGNLLLARVHCTAFRLNFQMRQRAP